MSSEDARSSTVLKMQRQIDRIEIEGEWCRVDSSLKVSNVIYTTKPIMSSDKGLQISIHSDSRGEIKLVDEDSDVQICFPKLKGLSSNVRWVLKDKFKHMLCQKALANEAENGTSTKASGMTSWE